VSKARGHFAPPPVILLVEIRPVETEYMENRLIRQAVFFCRSWEISRKKLVVREGYKIKIQKGLSERKLEENSE